MEDRFVFQSFKNRIGNAVFQRGKKRAENPYSALQTKIKEDFIIERLLREGQDGNITKIKKNTFIYEKEVFDGNEMMPWIKTFIGRIISFDSNNLYIKKKFYYDLQQMINMYK